MLHTYSYQNEEEILITITFLIFATGHVVLSGKCNYLQSIFCLLSASVSTGHGSLPCEMTRVFIPEGPRPLAILPELHCCSFLLTLITGDIDGCPRGVPALQTYSSLPHCIVATQFSLSDQDQSPQPI